MPLRRIAPYGLSPLIMSDVLVDPSGVPKADASTVQVARSPRCQPCARLQQVGTRRAVSNATGASARSRVQPGLLAAIHSPADRGLLAALDPQAMRCVAHAPQRR